MLLHREELRGCEVISPLLRELPLNILNPLGQTVKSIAKSHGTSKRSKVKCHAEGGSTGDLRGKNGELSAERV